MENQAKNSFVDFIGCLPLDELYKLRKTHEYLKKNIEDLSTCYPFDDKFTDELECAIRDREEQMFSEYYYEMMMADEFRL